MKILSLPLYTVAKFGYNENKLLREVSPAMQMDYTRRFSLNYEKDQEIKAILTSVFNSLQEKGYNPINQIVGYILSEDPTYITNYNNARALIRKLDRDELLQELVKQYLND